MTKLIVQIKLFALITCFCSLGLSSEPISVLYPKPSGDDDVREAYFFELLELALSKSKQKYGDYSLDYSDVAIPDRRIPNEVRRGALVSIFTSPASTQLESSFLAIKMPLVKGIQGLRVLLIHEASEEKFQSISNFEQLSQVEFGMGAGWLDAMIFNDTKLKVTEAPDYSGLFKMLSLGRFEAFPRGINEADRELSQLNNDFPELMIEPSLLIYYDLPVYFFVNKDNLSLHDRVREGLLLAKQDGSFDKLFDRYYAAIVNNANLEERRIFRLVNKYTPNIDKAELESYWLPFIIKNFSD